MFTSPEYCLKNMVIAPRVGFVLVSIGRISSREAKSFRVTIIAGCRRLVLWSLRYYEGIKIKILAVTIANFFERNNFTDLNIFN